MAKHYLLKCTECDSIDEIYCDGDNPMFCPDCRSVDCFESIDEIEDDFILIEGGKND